MSSLHHSVTIPCRHAMPDNMMRGASTEAPQAICSSPPFMKSSSKALAMAASLVIAKTTMSKPFLESKQQATASAFKKMRLNELPFRTEVPWLQGSTTIFSTLAVTKAKAHIIATSETRSVPKAELLQKIAPPAPQQQTTPEFAIRAVPKTELLQQMARARLEAATSVRPVPKAEFLQQMARARQLRTAAELEAATSDSQAPPGLQQH